MLGCRNEEVYSLIVQQSKPLIQEQLQLLSELAVGEGNDAVGAGSADRVHEGGGADSEFETPQAGPATGTPAVNDSFDAQTFNFMHASSLCYGLAKAG